MYNIKTFNSSKWSIKQSISLHDTSYAHGVSVAKKKRMNHINFHGIICKDQSSVQLVHVGVKVLISADNKIHSPVYRKHCIK